MHSTQRTRKEEEEGAAAIFASSKLTCANCQALSKRAEKCLTILYLCGGRWPPSHCADGHRDNDKEEKILNEVQRHRKSLFDVSQGGLEISWL
jgi:hypothetical protein